MQSGCKEKMEGMEGRIDWRTRIRWYIVPAGSAQRKRRPSLDPTLTIARPSVTKLDARRRRRMTRSGKVDVQGMYWDGYIPGEDLRAPNAYIVQELGRRQVSDEDVIYSYRFA
jgi:hypothetical protein